MDPTSTALLMKTTPLYDAHVAARGKLVDFAGWAMPLQYSGVVDEYHAVRSAAALFDVIGRGVVCVDINQRCALSDARQAHEDLENRKTTGTTILLP